MNEGIIQDKAFDIYEGYNLAILIPKKGIKFNKQVHTYKNFELFYYGIVEVFNQPVFMAIFIERNYLLDICKTLFKNEDLAFRIKKIKPDKEIRDLIEMFIKEARAKQAGYELVLKSISVQISIKLIRKASQHLMVIKKERLRYTAKENINRVIKYFLNCYNEGYSLENAAKVANLSPYHFIRVFKAETGKTPYEYFIDIKIRKAREMFESKNHNVTEVCFLCGFENASHFSTVFKKKVGKSPMEYRKLVSVLSP